MKSIKMWGHRGSSCCQKVLWSADELGIAIELTETGGGHGGLGTPEYIARNPTREISRRPVVSWPGEAEAGPAACTRI